MGGNAAELTTTERPIGRVARAWNAVGVASLLCLATAWNQSLVHWRENTLDSYLFGYYGWRVAHGARPYLDVWDNKPPAIWWANALAFRVLGEGPQADWAVGAAATLLTLAAFVGVACVAWHRSLLWPAALVAVLLLTNIAYECGANRTETLVMACETAGVFFYACWLRSGRVGWLVAAGVLLGAAPWCKQAGLGAAIGVAAHLFAVSPGQRGRRFAPLIAGAALPSLAAVAVLAAQGACEAARHAIFDVNRIYFEIGDASWWNLARPLEIYAPALQPLLAAGALALLVPLLLRRIPAPAQENGARGPTDIRLVLWLWLIVTFYLVCVGVGRLPYHLMPLLSPLGLLLLAPLGRIATAFGGPGRAVTRHPSAGALAVLTIGAAFHAALAGWNDSRQCLARRPSDAGWLPAAPMQYASQAAEIRNECPPAGTLYVWGWSPGTYRFAYRANACRFGTLEKMGHFGDAALFIIDEVIQTLRRAPPDVLAISPSDLRGIRGNRDDGLHGWIDEQYEQGPEIGGMCFLHRRIPRP